MPEYSYHQDHLTPAGVSWIARQTPGRVGPPRPRSAQLDRLVWPDSRRGELPLLNISRRRGPRNLSSPGSRPPSSADICQPTLVRAGLSPPAPVPRALRICPWTPARSCRSPKHSPPPCGRGSPPARPRDRPLRSRKCSHIATRWSPARSDFGRRICAPPSRPGQRAGRGNHRLGATRWAAGWPGRSRSSRAQAQT